MKGSTVRWRIGAFESSIVPHHFGHSQSVSSKQPVASQGLNPAMFGSIAPVRHGRFVAKEANRHEASRFVDALKSLDAFKTVHRREEFAQLSCFGQVLLVVARRGDVE